MTAPAWQPANDVERLLAAAVADGDVPEVMRIVAGNALFLPGFRDDGAAAGGRQHLLTRERDGVPYVLVFTSPEALLRTVPSDGWRATTLPDVVQAVPEGWGLAINPASPIVVLVPPDDVPRLVPTKANTRDFEPANDVERLLRDALVAPDAEVVLDVLVTCQVIVPTQALEMDGVLTVPAYTSVERYEESLGHRGLDLRTLTMDLVAVLQRWPGPEYTLAVNPGSPIAITMRGSRIDELLAYAVQVARRRGFAPPAPPGAGDVLTGQG